MRWNRAAMQDGVRMGLGRERVGRVNCGTDFCIHTYMARKGYTRRL